MNLFSRLKHIGTGSKVSNVAKYLNKVMLPYHFELCAQLFGVATFRVRCSVNLTDLLLPLTALPKNIFITELGDAASYCCW